MSSTYPEPPSYWRSGGPWTPPTIPTTEDGKRRATETAFFEPKVSTLPGIDAQPTTLSGGIRNLDGNKIREKLRVLFGEGGGNVGEIATLYADVLSDVATCSNSYQDHVKNIKMKIGEVRCLIEAYNQIFSLTQVIGSLRAQTEERKAAATYLEETVEKAKGALKQEAMKLQEKAQ